MRTSHWIIAAAVLGSTACGGGYVATQPPPERVEVIERPVGRSFVFVPGRWRWNGREYYWTSGRWVVPGRGRSEWVGGHWVRTPRGWRYAEGHWR